MVQAPRVYNHTRTLDVELTIDTDAYQANDVVGGLITVTIPQSKGGTIRRVNVVDADNEKAAFTLHFFDQVPTTTILDDAAFAPVIADLKKRIGVLVIGAGDYRTDNSLATADKHDVNFDFDLTAGQTADTAAVTSKLYAYLVCTATPTYTAADDLTLRFTIWTER